MKAGSNSRGVSKGVLARFSGYVAQVSKRFKAPKSKPKAANGRNPKMGGAKPFRKTWHKDSTWHPLTGKNNTKKWILKNREGRK